MIFHLALSSYIARTGVAAPWSPAPTDVLTGGGALCTRRASTCSRPS